MNALATDSAPTMADMRLISLHARDYRQLREVDILFPDGLIGIVGANGSGKCLPGWVRVYDPDLGEAVEIERFVRERRPRILGFENGKVVPVSVGEWHETGDKPTVEIRLDNGVRWETAASHPLMTPDGFTRAEDLRAGDWVAEVREMPAIAPRRLTLPEAYLLGLMIGDGTVSRSCLLTAHSLEVIAMFGAIVPEVFPGCEMRTQRNGTAHTIISRNKPEARRLATASLVRKLGDQSADLGSFLPDIRQRVRFLRGDSGLTERTLDEIESATGIDLWEERCAFNPTGAFRTWAKEMGIFGHHAQTKRIAPHLLLQPDDVTEGILAGLWMTDGFVSDRSSGSHEVSYTTASEGLALDVRLLLLRLGITSTVRSRLIKGSYYHEVRVLTTSFARFCSRIPLVGEKGRRMRRIIELRAGVKPNLNNDLIPPHFFKDLRYASSGGSDLSTWTKKNSGMSRRTFLEFGGDVVVAEAQTYWSRVVSSTQTGRTVPTFDVTLANDEHVYVADTFLVHNSGTMEILSVALHGIDAVKTVKEDLIRDESGADATMALEFSLGSHVYRVERKIRAKDLSSSAKLYRDGVVVANGTEATNSAVTDLVGSLAEFRMSRFVGQKQLDALSALKPAERKKTILRLMGVDPVEDAITELRRSIADLDRNVKARQAVLPDAAQIGFRITELERERKTIIAHQATVERDIAARMRAAEIADAAVHAFDAVAERSAHSTVTRSLSREALAEIAARESELDESDIRLREVATRLAEAEATLASAEEHRAELSDLERVASLLKSAEALREQRRALEQAVTTLEHEHAALAATAGREKTRMADAARATRDGESAARDQATAEAKRAELQAAYKRRVEERRNIAVSLEHLETSTPDVCPTCAQAIADGSAFRKHLETALAEADADIERIKAEGVAAKARSEAAATRVANAGAEAARVAADLETIREAASAARVTSATLDGRRADLASVVEQISEAEAIPYDADRHAQLSAESGEVPALLSLIATARGELSEVERNSSERSRLLGRSAELEERLAAAEQAMADAGYSPDDHEAAKAHAADCAEAVTAARLEGARLEGDLRVADEQLRLAIASREGFAAANAEISRMLADRGVLKLTLEWMDRFKVSLIGRIRPALSRKASRLLEALTDGRYTDLTLTPDYDITFGMAGKQKPIRRASGGEEDLLNLCVRLAISELMNEATGVGRTFLVLDEVLSAQDADREAAIMDLLPKLGAHFGQVLMIAHKPAAQDRFESVIEVHLDRVSETSTVRYPASLPDLAAA